jgi:hypothetical protein
MELMTEPKFFPPASVWYLMPKLMGSARPVGWLTVEDLAVIAAPTVPDAPLAVRAVRGYRRDDHVAMAGHERGRLCYGTDPGHPS